MRYPHKVGRAADDFNRVLYSHTSTSIEAILKRITTATKIAQLGKDPLYANLDHKPRPQHADPDLMLTALNTGLHRDNGRPLWAWIGVNLP